MLNEEERQFIDFGSAYLERACVYGLSIVDLPATPASAACYVLCVYHSCGGSSSVISITYDTAEERDAKYEEFKGKL